MTNPITNKDRRQSLPAHFLARSPMFAEMALRYMKHDLEGSTCSKKNQYVNNNQWNNMILIALLIYSSISRPMPMAFDYLFLEV